MLNTYEEKPQMIVEIDSKPAVCHSMSCGFTHVPAVGEITSFAITQNPWKLTVSGTELPDNLSKIQSISIAASTCTVQGAAEDGALSGTSIECLLDREPVCGDWEPLVTTFFGNVPMQADLTKSRVDCTIASSVPDTSAARTDTNGMTLGINLLGNDNITFTGTNFPHEIEGNTFELKFDNAAQTNCEVVDTSTTELVCLTDRFDLFADQDGNYNMVVVINGVTVTHSI